MRRHAHLGPAGLALACLALALTGPSCPEPAGPTTSPAALAPGASDSIQIVVEETHQLDGTTLALVFIEVDTDAPLQAYELDLHWDPATTTLVNRAWPDAEFEADGEFLREGRLDAETGRLLGIVDLRRGAPTAGPCRIVGALFQIEPGVKGVVAATGRFARPDGSLVALDFAGAALLP